jgi:hypothetical protein
MEAAENSSWDLANIWFWKAARFFNADISLAVLLANYFMAGAHCPAYECCEDASNKLSLKNQQNFWFKSQAVKNVESRGDQVPPMTNDRY